MSLNRWTAEEDRALLLAVKEGQVEQKSLREIFTELGDRLGRSLYSCFGRYYLLTGKHPGLSQKAAEKKRRRPSRQVAKKTALRAAFKKAAEVAGGRLTSGVIEKIAKEHGVPYHHALSVWGLMHAGGEVFALEREELVRKVQEQAEAILQLQSHLEELQKRVAEQQDSLQEVLRENALYKSVIEKMRAALA